MLKMELLKLLTWMKKHAKKVIFLLVISYLLASIVNIILSFFLVKTTLFSISKKKTTKVSSSFVETSLKPKFNFFDFRKVVLDRHLFSIEGHFPQDENVKLATNKNDKSCAPLSLNIRLIGIIFNQDPKKSVVTIFDNSVKITDVYREGDAIIDHPATVVSIERTKVVINNSGSVECLSSSKSNTSAEYAAFDRQIETRAFPSKVNSAFDDSAIRTGGVVVLKDSYVESQLGQGFSNIIQSARFVPTDDGAGNTLGFKVFAIKPNTLFLKIGLKNGDIIAQVNETSLTKVEQGFALYQALQDENELTIKVLRNQQPVTIRVKIES